MNPVEKDKLRFILEDDVMLSALRKLFSVTIEKNKPTIKDENDSVVGQKYRGYTLSKEILNSAFIELESYRKGESETSISNRAR